MTLITPPLRRDLHQHALAEFEQGKESCGILVREGEEVVYLPCENIHPEPANAFRIKQSVIGPHRLKGTLVAVVHSHPNGPGAPTAADMRGQAQTDVPWIILIFGEGINAGRIVGEIVFPISLDEPLLQMEFVPGVRDCFTLVRKWWWQNKRILLPEFPRDPTWWITDDGQPGDDLYMQGYREAGFRELAPAEIFEDPEDPNSKIILPVGAVGLARVMSPWRINHAVVYTGGQQMMHHLTNRISGEDPLSRWFPKIEHWLWRDDADDERPPLRQPGDEPRSLPPARRRERRGSPPSA